MRGQGLAFVEPRRFLLLFGLCSMIAILLVACSGGDNGGTTQPTKTTTNGGGAASAPTATPTAAGVKLGTQNCPEAVKSSTYWDPLVGTQPNVSKVEKVLCANLIGVNALQALVLVRADGSGAILDLHVFNKITDPKPTELFKLQNLYKGDAKISVYNTLMTGEVDQNSSVNKGAVNANLKQDLFREFKWSDGAGTFVPVAFPGIYPHLTRYEAETEQQNVNQGNNAWKLSAQQTASHLTTDLLKWSAGDNATIVSGGGKTDADAVVKVKSPFPGGGTIQAKMSRLEGNTNGGIWIVTEVTGDGLQIATPVDRDRINTPIKITGKGKAFEGVVGKAAVLDHTYVEIGTTQAKGAQGMGDTTFSVDVPFKSTFKTGAQEGVIVIYTMSNADGSIASSAMRKVLIGA